MVLSSSSRRQAAAAALAVTLGPALAAAADPPARTGSDTARAPVTVDVGGHLGAAIRVDDPPAFELTERAGLRFGAGALVAPAPAFAVGLGYEHVALGHEASKVGELGAVEVDRNLSTLWVLLRVFPLRTGPASFYLGLAPGLVWQSADATGVAFTGPVTTRGVGFACAGSASASFALRGAIGVDAALSEHVRLIGEASLDGYRLTSDVLDGCVPGAGSATVFGLTAGVAYRFDVTRFVR